MAPLTSWRGGLLLLFSSSIFAGTGSCQIDHSLPVPMTQRLLGSFLRRKGGAGFLLVAGPAARVTRPEPPCSMPPVCDSPLGPDTRTPGSSPPGAAVWPRCPRPSGPAPHPRHPRRLLARTESLDPGGTLPLPGSAEQDRPRRQQPAPHGPALP